MKLTGQVALITGGGRGIGRAVAETFAREDAIVFVVARTGEELEEVAAAIRSAGGRASWFQGDVSDASTAERAVEACVAAFGTVTVLVNAAGVYGPIGRSWEVDPVAWARAVEVNLFGTLHCCRAAIPVMQQAGGGRIINFSGGGATSPLPRFSAYAASKAAVVRFTETLAEELEGTGITVNAIAPGAVDTKLQDEVLAAGERAGKLYERIRKLRASGEGGVSPELAAGLAVLLAAPAGGALSGKLISAAHDGWQAWDAERIHELATTPWLTLRRLDEHTLRPLLESLQTSLPLDS